MFYFKCTIYVKFTDLLLHFINHRKEPFPPEIYTELSSMKNHICDYLLHIYIFFQINSIGRNPANCHGFTLCKFIYVYQCKSVSSWCNLFCAKIKYYTNTNVRLSSFPTWTSCSQSNTAGPAAQTTSNRWRRERDVDFNI